MNQKFRPVILASVAVLVLASAGAASAGPDPDGTDRAVSKAAVKKIAKKQANKVVKEKAPSLSVNHAKSADTASTANSATSAATANSANSATNANNANNANNLGGQAPSAYQNRVAFKTRGAGGYLAMPVATPKELTFADLTIPAGVNFVSASGVVSLDSPGLSLLWVTPDQNCAIGGGPWYDARSFGQAAAATREVISYRYVFPATTGVHRYRLCAYTTSGGTYVSEQLVVETIAGGASGGSSLGARSPEGSAPGGDPVLRGDQ